MSKKLSRIIAAVMFVLAISFLAFALTHPNASFPWSNAVTYAIYAVYIWQWRFCLSRRSKGKSEYFEVSL